jgi:hypothetical protein
MDTHSAGYTALKQGGWITLLRIKTELYIYAHEWTGIPMKSVWFRWNDRYEEIIGIEDEKPDFIIKSLSELPGILRSV